MSPLDRGLGLGVGLNAPFHHCSFPPWYVTGGVCTHKTLCNVARGQQHPNNNKGTVLDANTEHACTCTAPHYLLLSCTSRSCCSACVEQLQRPKSLNLAHLKVQTF